MTRQLAEERNKPPSVLEQALGDAEVLVSYATRYNVPNVYDAIEAVSTAQDQYSHKRQLSPDVKKNFYAAFSTFITAVAPATVASLRASLDRYGRKTLLGERRSLAHIATRHRQAQAILVLLALVICQAVWFIASNIFGSLEKVPVDEASIWRDEIAEGGGTFREAVRLSSLIKSIDEWSLKPWTLDTSRIVVGSASPTPTPEVTPPPIPTPTPAATPTPRTTNSDDMETKKAAYMLWAVQRQDRARRLLGWMNLIDPLHIITGVSAKPSGAFKFEIPVEYVDWQNSVIFQAKYLNDIIAQFFLPPLYGWLGALAYVLRTLSGQAKGNLYRREDEIVWNLRICLGILAGLAIGWFFKASNVEVNGIGLVSPYALAFVAGYSVDLLFTAMDRIVAAFSGSEKVPSGPPVPQEKDSKPQSTVSPPPRSE